MLEKSEIKLFAEKKVELFGMPKKRLVVHFLDDN